jgi:hypothetical protein
MTEEEWFESTDSMAMVHRVWKESSDRKLRLFGVACCDRIRSLIRKPVCLDAVVTAAMYADGLASSGELKLAYDRVKAITLFDANGKFASGMISIIATASVSSNFLTEQGTPSLLGTAHHALQATSDFPVEWRAQSNLLRDIFGNPFHPIVADPAWLTPTVQSIASAICADRAFDRLPVLADALEEAGCTNADVLLHCRQPGEHVRGCWVVDLVLGKT